MARLKFTKGFIFFLIVVLISIPLLFLNTVKGGDTMQALIETNKGSIKIELYPDKAPITVENFKDYADSGFYEGTVFHRVVKDFMIQGGGFTTDGNNKNTNEPIKNEASNGLSNEKGTIAMARTNVVDSATSQFFINLVDNPFLDYQSESNNNDGYAVFGKVIEGMEVVELIGNTPTTSKGMHENWPLQDVIINKVTIIE